MTVAVVAALAIGASSMVVLVARGQVSAKYVPGWVLLPMYEMELVTLAQLGEDLWVSTPNGHDFWTAGAGKRILESVIERPQSYRDLQHALEKFVEIGEGDFAYQTALRFLGDRDPEVRAIAAFFIVHVYSASSPSLEDLERLWQNDNDGVRIRAIFGTRKNYAGYSSDEKVMEWLPMAARDPSAMVRAIFVSRLIEYCEDDFQSFASEFPGYCLDGFLYDIDPIVVQRAIGLKEMIAFCKDQEEP